MFCWKHYRNGVFSGTQLLGTTDSKTPFRGKTQNGTFATKSAILGFPLCPPYFCSVWWLSMGTKKSDIFQKQIVATKMRTFFTFRTQIVFAYFSKKWQFYKQIKIPSQQPKKHYFSGLFLKFSFSIFFMFCLFLFPTWKRQKQKVHIFFSKTLFWHLDKLPKNYFRTPTHYLCFLRYPKNTIKLGKNKQKKILDQVLTQPWTRFWLKKPQILDQVLTLQHAYIYIYIYACCRVKHWSKIWGF